MLSKVYAPALFSLDGRLIEIECDMANGLPGFVVVGLADKAVEEARERVRSTIRNSGLILPQKRLTLNLAPADLPKDGTGYDLGLAVAVLVASGQLSPESVQSCLFLGELALDGTVRPVRGALLAAQLAQNSGFKRIFVPSENGTEAALVADTLIYPVTSLAELYRHLSGGISITIVNKTTFVAPIMLETTVDIGSIAGQDMPKRAAEIAAAGGHNLILSGPPGAGKSLLAKAMIGLLPALEFEEMVEVTRIYSLAGLNFEGVISRRPFRSPHHTASSVALIGGGAHPKPGEISLSHRGILFLDELPEFPRAVLEVMRQPLEDGSVTVSRASHAATFPAQFMLVGTRNPCPCGYAGDPHRKCSCTSGEISRYQHRLSGPFMDRIDLVVEVARVQTDLLIDKQANESTVIVAERVGRARGVQRLRYRSDSDIQLNSQITPSHIDQYCELDTETKLLAKAAMNNLGLSARGYSRTLKVARTIADLAGLQKIGRQHFTEALQYRARG